MARTVLAGIALLSLLACGGAKPRPAARTTRAAPPAAQTTSGSTKAQQRRTSSTTQRDTVKHVNPLTGH